MFDYAIMLAVFVFLTTTVGFAVAWSQTRKRAVNAEAALNNSLGREAKTDGRLEDAVADLALEMERLTEGHRFIARMLTEKLPAASQPPIARER